MVLKIRTASLLTGRLFAARDWRRGASVVFAAQRGAAWRALAWREVLDLLPQSSSPRTPSRFIRIEVRDHGKGIPTETREKIFEPYFTTKRKKTGSGLGLTTVKEIVEDAGGFISVLSGIGRGTSFSIYLPVLEKKP